MAGVDVSVSQGIISNVVAFKTSNWEFFSALTYVRINAWPETMPSDDGYHYKHISEEKK